jgi:hypothetical protein
MGFEHTSRLLKPRSISFLRDTATPTVPTEEVPQHQSILILHGGFRIASFTDAAVRKEVAEPATPPLDANAALAELQSMSKAVLTSEPHPIIQCPCRLFPF